MRHPTVNSNMASKVIIDFESIGEQIGTAIKSSIEKVSEQLLANKSVKEDASKDEGNRPESTIEIREQILGKCSSRQLV